MDTTPQWVWNSDDLNTNATQTENEAASPSYQPAGNDHGESTARQRRRYYGPRTCRICLDVVQPKFESGGLFGLGGSQAPTYDSDEPELGRLISPCKCKGTQKYVHTGCLQAWRLANVEAERNYFTCPTCGFKYRLERLRWANVISSIWTQIALTIVMCIIIVFILGFFGDPILKFWNDPAGVVADTVGGIFFDLEDEDEPPREIVPFTWTRHFFKGFLSLSVVGFFKYLIALSPWQWGNLRTISSSGRRGGSDRDRDSVNWALVIIGATTALYAIWKGIRAICKIALERASSRVLDVGGNTEDEQEEGDNATENKKDI
jgi:hypothetical protein